MLEDEDIIIFSSDDWDSGLKSSKYHIAVGLARKNRVLFVNSVGLRNPTASASDLRRIVAKLRGWFKGWRQVRENLFVYTPIVLPLHGLRFARPINRTILVTTMRVLQRRLGMRSPILLIFIPNMGSVVGKLGEKCAVYYCIDELKAYKDVNTEAFEEMERRLLAEADCTITCSRTLWESKSPGARACYYVPHGVDWAHFRRTLTEDIAAPADVAVLRKPVIGYYGFISDDWIDFDLLNDLAAREPGWSFVLIGRSKGDLTQVLRGDNITFLGVRDFEELPAYNKAFDVAIIPFRINDLTRDCNPLKLYEYLSSGVPVVSVRIPEVERHADLVRIADDSKGFRDQIACALGERSAEKDLKRSDEMRKETWEDRLERISEIVHSHAAGAAR